MPLIKDGTLVEDAFTPVSDDAPLPEGAVIVSLSRFLAERETLLSRNAPFGVRLKSDESPEVLRDDLPRLSLMVLEFAKFRDGRPFSWARMLRTRFGFTGEIRAVGDFLYDQLAFMCRVGFDAFEPSKRITPEALQRALREITFVYQPSADGRKTIRDLRA
jgi:uncharacterized protein (DUF934 family)